MSRTTAQWAPILIACGVKPPEVAVWSPVFAATIEDDTFSKGDADISDWLPEILHESGYLTRMVEDLHYSAKRLTEVWPGRFPTLQVAQPYANNPEALANLVYGGRLGNNLPGDGWKYIGRSPIQITGKANYLAVGRLIGNDLDVNPTLLEGPYFALMACVAWWENKIPDSMLGETTTIRQRVNGGSIGLAEVQALTTRVRAALAA